MPLEIDITTQSTQWPENIFAPIENAARSALKAANITNAEELSIVLADDPFVQNLNKTYRNKDKPTNVLSFPQDEPQENIKILGDIILAFETIAREAQEQNKTFHDHTIHLTVHGVLHLLGHDHETDDEAEIMEALEIAILQELGIKNPYES